MILTLSQVRPIPTPLPRQWTLVVNYSFPSENSNTLPQPWTFLVNYSFPPKNSNLQGTPIQKLINTRSQNVNFRIDGPCKLIKFAANFNVYEEPPLGEPCFARRKLINFRFANGAICELMVTEWTVFVN